MGLRLINVITTLATGLVVTLSGISLSYYQSIQSDLQNTAIAAIRAVHANERLLDQASYVAMHARPLLYKPCTLQTRTELGRLAIGNEHIRLINLFNKNHLVCSSWDGTRIVKDDNYAGIASPLTLLKDDYVSPGVSVVVLRTTFSEGIITTSMTTRNSAEILKLLSTRYLLSLRAGNKILTQDNQLRNGTEEDKNGRALYVVNSHRYPFSVEYEANWKLSSLLFLRENVLSFFLSVIFGGVVAAGLWMLAFRNRTPYEQLTASIEKGEIVPWYQPVIDSQTGNIIGLEVLARLEKPDGTILTPDSFILLAESSDLIIPLTRSLMIKAAHELPAILKNEECCWHIGINITQAHLLNDSFITECMDFLNAFPHGTIMLTIELTEREPFDSSDEMQSKLKILHDNGIMIALDDFGTGYANLEYLSEIHIDMIKIDRVFVWRIGAGDAADRLLTSLIDMASAHNMKIIAEGVETLKQSEWLTSRGVVLQQGYLYSPPVASQELQKFFEKNISNF